MLNLLKNVFASLNAHDVREKRGCGGAIIPRFSPRHGEATGIHGLPHVRRWRT